MQSYPFTSQVTYDEQGLPLYDRAVDSEFLRQVFAAYFSDGIFYKPTNALQVVAGTGLQVQVNPGICHIRGAIGIETETRTLTVSDAGSLPRIDTVVARLDLSLAVRSIDLYVKAGTAAGLPTAPTLTRDSTTWELGLANILLNANSSTISQSNITDTRLDTTRCGLVAQTIGSLDTSPYFAQLETAIAEHQTAAEAQIDELEEAIAGVEGDTAWMLKSLYDPQNKNKDIFKSIDAAAAKYEATLTLDGWVTSTSEEQSAGYPYAQEATLTALTPGAPTVTAYAFDERLLEDGSLRVKLFEGPGKEWALFVMANRTEGKPHGYDIVVGPVTDDGVAFQLERYARRMITLDVLVEELTCRRLNRQYYFGSELSISKLKRL